MATMIANVAAWPTLSVAATVKVCEPSGRSRNRLMAWPLPSPQSATVGAPSKVGDTEVTPDPASSPDALARSAGPDHADVVWRDRHPR